MPKRKPYANADAAKAPPKPKKFVAFSPPDSRVIEARYQKLLEATEDQRSNHATGDPVLSPELKKRPSDERTRAEHAEAPVPGETRVPVNEDFLFDVNVEKRELGPVYWLGPIYEGLS